MVCLYLYIYYQCVDFFYFVLGFGLAIGIRYGKYCGVGWSGCPGEKPCDDLDACCKIHDDCVEKNGTSLPGVDFQMVVYRLIELKSI